MKFHDNCILYIYNIFSMCATPLNRKLVNCLFSLVPHAPDAVLPAGTMSTQAGNCNACCDARRTIARCKSDMKRWWRQGAPGLVIRFSRWYLPPKRLVLLHTDLQLHCMSMYIIMMYSRSAVEHAGCMLPPEKQLEAAQMAPHNYSQRPRTH